MKKTLLILLGALLVTGLSMAQEKTEVNVKVVKDGKTVKDTVYTYEDAEQADHALKILDVMSNEELHMEHAEHMNVRVKKMDGKDGKKMIFVSEDGNIHKMDGDHANVWVTLDEESDKEGVKVVTVTVDEDGEEHVNIHTHGDFDGEHHFSEDGKNIEVIVKKMKGDGDHKVVKKEKILIVSDDKGEKGTWTVKEEDGKMMMINEEGEVIDLIKDMESDEDGKVVKWVSDEGDDMQIVIMKKEIEGEEEEEIEIEVTIEEEKDKKKNKKKK